MTGSMVNPRPRVGLIGAGGIAGVHLQGWLALDAQIIIYSLDGAEELAAGHQGVQVVTDLDELWPLIDVVDIVTPTATHTEFALAAIGQGKHVVCEKPLARTSTEAAEVVDAAEKAGVRLFPAHVVRYFPEYAATHAAVSAGRLGTLAVNRFRRMSAAPRAEWFFDDAVSGGIVLDQMIHDLDQALWLAGPVETVFAQSTKQAGEDGKTATATVTLTHTSGAISYCFGVWGYPGLAFTYSFEIAGDTGKMGYDKALDDTARVQLGGGQSGGGYIPVVPASDSPYAAELADFWSAITTGEQARVTGRDGVDAIELAEAALASIASGEPQRMTRTTEGQVSH